MGFRSEMEDQPLGNINMLKKLLNWLDRRQDDKQAKKQWQAIINRLEDIAEEIRKTRESATDSIGVGAWLTDEDEPRTVAHDGEQLVLEDIMPFLCQAWDRYIRKHDGKWPPVGVKWGHYISRWPRSQPSKKGLIKGYWFEVPDSSIPQKPQSDPDGALIVGGKDNLWAVDCHLTGKPWLWSPMTLEECIHLSKLQRGAKMVFVTYKDDESINRAWAITKYGPAEATRLQENFPAAYWQVDSDDYFVLLKLEPIASFDRTAAISRTPSADATERSNGWSEPLRTGIFDDDSPIWYCDNCGRPWITIVNNQPQGVCDCGHGFARHGNWSLKNHGNCENCEN